LEKELQLEAVICKYFVEGNCKYGESCENIHEYPSSTTSSSSVESVKCSTQTPAELGDKSEGVGHICPGARLSFRQVECPKGIHFYCATCFDKLVKSQINNYKKLDIYCTGDYCSASFRLDKVFQTISKRCLDEIVRNMEEFGFQEGLKTEKARQRLVEEEYAKLSWEERKVLKLRVRMEELANRRCPNSKCRKVYDDFQGCCAVTCTCETIFCAFCEQPFPNEPMCHSHIRGCEWNPRKPSISIDKSNWLVANKRCKASKILMLWNSLTPEVRELAKDETIVGILNDHGFDVCIKS
jgi:hypothetical protein